LKNDFLPSIYIGFLFSLVIPVVLYHYRFLDDNSLCRWEWVFAEGPPRILFGFTVVIGVGSLLLSKLSWPKNTPLFLGLIAFLVGIGLWSEPEILIDASRYFTQAKYLKVYGIREFWQGWGDDLSAWTDLPLLPFFYGLVLTGLGESRIYIQIFTTLFFVGSVLTTYLLAKDLWDEETGLLAGLLLLCQPYLLLHIPLMLVDLPTMFFLVLTSYTFSRALIIGTPRWVLMAVISIFCLFWVKYSAWLMLTILPVIFMVYYNQDPKKSRRIALQTIALALLFILPIFIGLRDVILEQLRLLIDYQRPGLNRWSESFLSTFFFQIHPLVTLAALFGFGAALLKKDRKIIIPCFLIILLVLILQVKRIRYLMPIFPLLAITAAYGIRRLPSQRLQKYLVLSSLGSSLIMTFGALLPFTKHLSITNIQNSGRFLNTLDSSNIAVFTAHQAAKDANFKINIPLLDLYTHKRIYSLDSITEVELKPIDKTSSFRFSWEQKLPDFYQPPIAGNELRDPLVVISLGLPRLPADILTRTSQYRYVKEFKQNTRLFSYKTFATIYYD
jgi:4-amino-4-deoxy-L-arabinose transferase-like glycosyltransferase